MQKNVDILNTMDNVPVLVVAVLLCCLAAAAVAVVAAKMPQARVPTPTPGPGITLSGGLGSQTWVIVGGGLTAVSCIRRLPSSMRSIITLREAAWAGELRPQRKPLRPYPQKPRRGSVARGRTVPLLTPELPRCWTSLEWPACPLTS